MVCSATGRLSVPDFRISGLHDAGVVDQDVQRRVFGLHLDDETLKVIGALDVEREGFHAGVGGGGLVERSLAAAGDDDLVAPFVEGFGERAADAAATAGDEGGVYGCGSYVRGLDARPSV